MKRENILSHYNKDEIPFVGKVIDWSERVAKKHVAYLTDFLDPRQLEIVRDIVNSYNDLTVFFYGGYEDAERVRALITPDYSIYDYEEMGLTIFKVDTVNNTKEIIHPDVLGALLNIGLKRDKFGDIILTENEKYIIVAKEVSDYVSSQLTKINSLNVTLSQVDTEFKIDINQKYDERIITVSSLRVDSIISSLYNISRSKASDMVKKDMLKVNWRSINSVDYKLEEGDILSLRGFGRSKFFSEEKFTKKGKYRLKFGKIL